MSGCQKHADRPVVSSVFDGTHGPGHSGGDICHNMTFIVDSLFTFYALIRWTNLSCQAKVKTSCWPARAFGRSCWRSIRGVRRRSKLNNKTGFACFNLYQWLVIHQQGGLPRNSLSGFQYVYRALFRVLGKIVLIWLTAAQVLDGSTQRDAGRLYQLF